MPPYGFSSLEIRFFVGQKISVKRWVLKIFLNFGGLLLKICLSHFRKLDGLSTQESLVHFIAHLRKARKQRGFNHFWSS